MVQELGGQIKEDQNISYKSARYQVVIFDNTRDTGKYLIDNYPELSSGISHVQKSGKNILLRTMKGQLYSFGKDLERILDSEKESSTFLGFCDSTGYYAKTNQGIQILDFANQLIKEYHHQEIKSFKIICPTKCGTMIATNSTQDIKNIWFLGTRGKSKVPPFELHQGHPRLIDAERLMSSQYQAFNDSKIYLINDGIYINEDPRDVYTQSGTSYTRTNDIHISNVGNIYVANQRGITIIKPKDPLFNRLHFDEDKGNSVRGIIYNKDIRLFQNKTQEFLSSPSGKYDLSFLKKGDLNKLAIGHYQDPSNPNLLWTTNWSGNRFRLINLENRTVHFGDQSIRLTPPKVIHRSKTDQRIYLAGTGGIFRSEGSDHNLVRVDLSQYGLDSNQLDINQIKEYDNHLIMASHAGIIAFDPTSNSVNSEFHWPSFSEYKLNCIHYDEKENTLFLGTRFNGLIKYDLLNGDTLFINKNNSLADNWIHDLIPDSLGRLWMPTNKFLYCIDPDNLNVAQFTPKENISHAEFNQFGSYKDPSTGIIYLGSLNGYTYFKPEDFTKDTNQKSKIRIQKVDILDSKGRQYSIQVNGDPDFVLDMNDDQMFFEIQLMNNEYINADLHKYYFKVQGIDEKWKVGQGNTITIGKVPYGEWVLQIQANVSSPLSSSEVLDLPMSYPKPLYKTLGFALGCLIMALGLVFFLNWLYYRNVSLRNEQLEKQVQERTKELSESNEIKSKLFAILAHDLRNPLASLSDIPAKVKWLVSKGRLEEIDILADQTKGKLSAIENNLNNLFVWALAEMGELPNHPEKLSIRHEIEQILEIYSTQISKKQLTHSIDFSVIDQVFVDSTILQTIFRNVLSNAIKFSDHGSNLSFTKIDETAERVSIGVLNTGQDLLIEERTKQEDKSGTGIGLKISNDMAQMADIHLELSSVRKGMVQVLINMPKS